MSIIHGGKIQIYNSSGSVLMAAANSCTIHKHADVIEKASSTSSTDKEFIPGRTSWSIDLAYLITTSTGGLPLVGTKYYIKVMVNDAQAMSGYVICTDCDIQATQGNLSKGSIKMQGTGPLA